VNDLLEVIYVELLTKFRSFRRKTAIQIFENFGKYDSVRVFSIHYSHIRLGMVGIANDGTKSEQEERNKKGSALTLLLLK
jgi:hypothetical protein